MIAKDRIRDEAICKLLSDPIHIEPGQTVYTLLRHADRSGMSRSISTLIASIDPNTLAPYIRDITGLSARVLGYSLDPNHGGIFCPSYGPDRGFWLVSQLSSVLFSNGFGCIGPDCPSCDHSNGDHSYIPHTKHAPHWHRSGDYALRQAWL